MPVFLTFDPQPPARYDIEYQEYGWLWSKSTSGEGAEQQDVWALPRGPFDARQMPANAAAASSPRFMRVDDLSIAANCKPEQIGKAGWVWIVNYPPRLKPGALWIDYWYCSGRNGARLERLENID